MPRQMNSPPQVKKIGWVFVALGAVSVIWPTIATLAVEQLVAWVFVLFGITGLLFWRSFRAFQVGGIGIGVAALALILGIVLVVSPMSGARTLTMLLGGLFFIEGVLGVMMSMSLRETHRGWIFALASSLATLVLSLVIFATWPNASAWIIGLLFGFHLLTTGIALLSITQKS